MGLRRLSGLTRAELAAAVVIVAALASVAVPAAMYRRILADEASAVAALHDVADAQARFQAAAYVDVNENGIGEYGFFRELSGAVGPRQTSNGSATGAPLNPPLLAREFRRIDRRGEVTRSGYVFKMFLPGAAEIGVQETRVGAFAVPLDSELCESMWGCYAWPAKHGVTGDRTFFVDQDVEVVSTDAAYSGPGAFRTDDTIHLGNAGAAFAPNGSAFRDQMIDPVAVGTVGRDGNLWQAVAPSADARELVAHGTFIPRNRRGSFEIVSHQAPAATYETLVVDFVGLRPGARYEVTVNVCASTASAIDVVRKADAAGRLSFRFDSRRRAYPAGPAALTDLVGGWIAVRLISDFEYQTFYAGVPEFETAGGATPSVAAVAADEASAIAALREIAAAQTKFQAMKAVDVDQLGVGDFGLLRELTGAVGVRTTANASTVGSKINPPLLSGAFAAFDADSDVSREGYLFRMFLPGAGGFGVPEESAGALGAAADLTLSDSTWCCYAWPRHYGETGKRTFFINQTGDVVATDSAAYSGAGRFIASNAGSAFVAGWALTNITGTVATGTIGRDGNLWRAVPSRPDDHDFVVRGALAPTTPGSSATGAFVVESVQSTNATDETVAVRATGLAPDTSYQVVLLDATGTSVADCGETWTDARGRIRFPVVSNARLRPADVAAVAAFGGGTIEVRLGGAAVLRGAIPAFADVLGAAPAGTSTVFHATAPLDGGPPRTPRFGSLDVRRTNAPGGAREQLTVRATTFDPGATFSVVTVDAHGAATPLGSIRAAGLSGVGALTLDTARGDVVPGGGLVGLSGTHVEVRSSTGAVVLAGTFPVVR